MTHQNTSPFEDNKSSPAEIDLKELLSAVWEGKWIIVAVGAIFTIISIIYVLSIPNIYKSEALLAPTSEDSALKLPGNIGGLAALAGVNFGGLESGDKTDLAIEIMKSREFLGRFIDEYDLYVPLMAVKGWSSSSNSLIIDHEIFDIQKKKWVRKVGFPFQQKPSLQEAHQKFLKHLTISKDKNSGMVRVSIEHYSPYLAKLWVELLISSINQEMRSRELNEAQRSISYLNTQVTKTSLSDLRTMLYSLIEEQTKTVVLANVRDEYVFKTIDRAVVPERKVKPNRVMIVLSSGVVGIFVALFVLLFFRSSR